MTLHSVRPLVEREPTPVPGGVSASQPNFARPVASAPPSFRRAPVSGSPRFDVPRIPVAANTDRAATRRIRAGRFYTQELRAGIRPAQERLPSKA